MLNVVIVGLGYIAPRVANGVKFAQGVNLYGVASRDSKKAQIFAEEVGCEHYFGSYEEMLADKNVDLVYLCTPNHLHFSQIKECFEHGKHVMCEKPLVSSSEEVKEYLLYRENTNVFSWKQKKHYSHL